MKYRNLLEDLLDKYLQRKLTITESRQFNDLLTDDLNEDAFKEVIYKHINEFPEGNSVYDSGVGFDKIYSNILSQLKTNQNIIRKRSLSEIVIYISSVAAILAGVFLLGRYLPFSRSENKLVSQPAYTEIKSPYGSKSEIKLPDGTRVILNAGSEMTYNNDYNSTNRNVSLTGEAYFKVARNETVPFIVNAGTISIKALGTEFNVKAYADENVIETTLITGKITITCEGTVNANQNIDLIPNQKAIIFKDEQGFRLEDLKDYDSATINLVPLQPILSNILIAPQVNIDQVVAWTEGKLILRGESLDRLCVELVRKYNVTVVFREEEIKKFRFTGVLLDETLEQVLNAISLTAPIRYSLDGKTVYLSSDPRSLNDFSKYMK